MRLSAPGPAAEEIPPAAVKGTWLAPCDATASGAEEAQVRLARGKDVLDLCGHHFADLGFALIASGWHVTHDNRGR